MTQFNISDPGLARGFGVLAQVLSGGGRAAIEGDMLRGQRQKIDSDIRYNDARSGLAGSQSALTDQQRRDLENYAAAAAELSAAITGNPDFTDPAVRAQVAGILPRIQGGLGENIGGLIGATGYVNPGAYSEDDWSTVLLSGGVVPNFASTATGQGRALNNDHLIAGVDANADITRAILGAQNNLDVTNLEHANDLAMMQARIDAGLPPDGTSGVPLDISPDDSNKLWELFTGALESKMGPYDKIDPALVGQLRPALSAEYQRTRNAEVAIANVLAKVGMATDRQDLSWLPTGKSTVIVPGAAGAPAAPTAAPASNIPPPGSPPPAPGSMHTLPNGQAVMFDGTDWVPVR